MLLPLFLTAGPGPASLLLLVACMYCYQGSKDNAWSTTCFNFAFPTASLRAYIINLLRKMKNKYLEGSIKESYIPSQQISSHGVCLMKTLRPEIHFHVITEKTIPEHHTDFLRCHCLMKTYTEGLQLLVVKKYTECSREWQVGLLVKCIVG